MILRLGQIYRVRGDITKFNSLGGVPITGEMLEEPKVSSLLKVVITDKTTPKKPELHEHHEYVRDLEYNKGIFWDMVNRYLADSAFDRFEIAVSLRDSTGDFFREVTHTRRK